MHQVEYIKPQIHGPNPDFDYSHNNNCEQPISLISLCKFTANEIQQQFKGISNTIQHKANQVGSSETFAKLNRYKHLLPYFHSMPFLTPGKQLKRYQCKDDVTAENYINADIVRVHIKSAQFQSIFNHEQSFLCTQGPLPETRGAFWQMVVAYKVCLIVMLCKLSKMKGGELLIQCEKYWPDEHNELIQEGDIQIRWLQTKTIQEGVFERFFELKTPGNEEWQLKQIHFSVWPDLGVPAEDQNATILNIIEEVNIQVKQNKSTIVHCSAGIGRTGTLVACCQIKLALEFQFSQIRQLVELGAILKDLLLSPEFGLSIFSIVRRLREQRSGLVEACVQYKYIYSFAVELIKKEFQL